MSNGKPIPRKILLGDKTIAARWLPYAKTIFYQTQKLNLYTRTVVVDPVDNVTIRVITRGAPSIYIKAEPKTRTFAGWRYDERHPWGWGGPYEGEGVEYAYDLEDTNKETPLFSYGTKDALTFKATGIKVTTEHTYEAQDFPTAHRDLLLDKGEDIEYGVTNWVSSNRKVILSWDGNPSRHATEFMENWQAVYDQDCSGRFFNIGKLGQYLTNGSECYPTGELFDTYGRRGGVHKLLKNSWTLDDVERDGDGVLIDYHLYDSSFTHVSGYSNAIYKDGRVYHLVPDEYIVTGASLTAIGGTTYISAIIALYNSDKGVYKEFHYLASPPDNKNGIITELEKSGDIYYDDKGTPQLTTGNYFDLHDARLDQKNQAGKSDTVWIWAPDRNTSLWAFDSTGKRAVAVRDYVITDPYYFEQNGSDFASLKRYVLEINLAFSGTNTTSVTVDMTRHNGSTDLAFQYYSTSSGGYPNVVHEHYNGAALVISADFRDDEIITAQTYTVMNDNAAAYGHPSTTHSFHYFDSLQSAFFVKGTTLLNNTVVEAESDVHEEIEPVVPYTYRPKIVEWSSAQEGDVVQEIAYSKFNFRSDDRSTGGYKYPEAAADGHECLNEEFEYYTNHAHFYELDARILYYFVGIETALYIFKEAYTATVGDSPVHSELREAVPMYPTQFKHYYSMGAGGTDLSEVINEKNPQYLDNWGKGGEGAVPNDDTWYLNDLVCPQEIFQYTNLNRGRPLKLGGSAVPYFLYTTGSHQSFSSWIQYGTILHLCVCTDVGRPAKANSVNRIIMIDLVKKEVIGSVSLKDLLKLDTEYLGTDVDMLEFKLKTHKFLDNSYNAHAPEGGFTNVGVI